MALILFAFGFGNVVELPEPIDYSTDGATLSGELNGKKGGLTFGYRYSAFKNDVGEMIFDNPFRITDSTDPSAYTAPGTGSGRSTCRRCRHGICRATDEAHPHGERDETKTKKRASP